MYIISNIDTKTLDPSKDALDQVVYLSLKRRESNIDKGILTHYSYSNEKGTYGKSISRSMIYHLIEDIYIHGFSTYHYELLKAGKEDFYIKNGEIALLAESVKSAIKQELLRRVQENRPYLNHTIRAIFEGEELRLNNKDDYDDIRILSLISFFDMLESAYKNGEVIYFCRYEPPHYDWK